MNTPTSPTLASFTPEQINTMSPETRATAVRQFIAAGHDKAQVEKTFGAVVTSPAAPAAPAAQASPPNKDKIAVVEHLKKHWTGDPAQLDAGLKKAGLEPVTDIRSKEEQAFDDGFAVPEGGDYRLNYTGRSLGDPAALAALNGKYREMFAAIALPGLAAQGILDTLLDGAARFSKLNDTQKKLYQQEQKLAVEKLGADMGDLKTIISFAGKALDRVKDQAFVKQLTDSGAFSAAGILHMARQGQRLAYREQLAAKRGQK